MISGAMKAMEDAGILGIHPVGASFWKVCKSTSISKATGKTQAERGLEFLFCHSGSPYA
ncbi:hypothetical protein HPY28_22775 [Brevibacillus sp. HB1.2]|uniref:hypothetical protein n=1 Tax=Brevibacillus sp. HB1.2 TaxID=2738807 RepID=UPI00037BED40|nr:hypothetical protein [Brevibacillus sp. HB1.2]NTU23144.1 hypothetical protein [Brevibacillus sp. HB1.2]